jgi:Mrp family chromosome partitioning ATPase
MEVNILLKYIRCQEKGKCAYLHGYSGVENVAEQKPINYIMES